jgi:hypothetical protein
LASALNLTGGLVLGGAVAGLVERIWNGRWIPPQAGVNLELAFQTASFPGRSGKILTFLFNSPIPWEIYAILLLILFAAGLVFHRPWIYLLGLPALSIISLLWGWARESAFGLSAQSQGLFFAWPWVILSLLHYNRKSWREKPLLLVGWGYILLLYLLAPDQPGIHWGPRFLLPALLPLLWCSVTVMKRLKPAQARGVMAITALGALLYGACSLSALAQRGAAGQEVMADLSATQFRTLILDRWHAGADLEPLAGKTKLLWAKSPGDLEELLIELREENLDTTLGWLKQETGWRVDDLPLEVQHRQALPGKGGWKGELLSVSLCSPDDRRWGVLYWHAGRRRAEAGDLSGALVQLQRAVNSLPEEADLHYDLAVTLGRKDRMQESLDELREALRLNPKHAPALRLWRSLVPR